MVSTLIIGKNTYASLAFSDTYLGDSARASAWVDMDADVKARALLTAFRLLERQSWEGEGSELLSLSAVAIQAGGTGYAVNDLVTVQGGTTSSKAVVKVTAVNTGVVTAVEIVDAGYYFLAPSNPVSTTGGTGTGLTLNLTFVPQSSAFPREDLDDKYDNEVADNTVPIELPQAQCELAYDLAVDTSVEESGGQGSNVKTLQAGSASISYFRPTAGVNGSGSDRFPPYVMELIGQYLAGSSASGTSGSFSSGTDVNSSFDQSPVYPYTQGLA